MRPPANATHRTVFFRARSPSSHLKLSPSPYAYLDKTKLHSLFSRASRAARDVTGTPRACAAMTARFREAPHVQFDSALIYSVSDFEQGGHFQA